MGRHRAFRKRGATARLESLPMANDALILFAHGARDRSWAAPFERILAQVRAAAPEREAMLAYLEFIEPDLPAAIAAQAAQGHRAIRVVPLFLGPGGHLRRELPQILEAARRAHPGVTIDATPPAGEDAGVIDALALFCLR
jgi:sirohydrochlorin cobaltochelatase